MNAGGSGLLETWAGDTGCSARMLVDTRLLVVGLVQMCSWSEELVREAVLGMRQNTHALQIFFFFQETLELPKITKVLF